MPKRSRGQLIEHLQEQIGFLRSSAEAFDAGSVAEAQRLATTIRVLVHHTGRSKSLLNQLGVQHQMRFLDTSRPPPQDAWRGAGEPLGRGPRGDPARRRDRLLQGAPWTGPRGHPGAPALRFWWNQPVLEDQIRDRFTRRELVLYLANQGGGSHVDPEIQSRWVALTRLNSLGWGWKTEGDTVSVVVPALPGDNPMGNPIHTNVRQIAYELERSITDHLGDLLGRGTAAYT